MKTKNAKAAKKAKRKKNYLLRILIFAVLCFCAYSLAMLGKEPVITETVRYGTMEDKININGYILRDEHVLTAPSDGMLSCNAREGERVTKGAKVAAVFEGKIDETLQSRIASINEQLIRLERDEIKKNLIIGDIVQIDAVIAKTVEDIVDAAYLGNMDKISASKNDLDNVLPQRMREAGMEVPKVDKKQQLLVEKAQLEEKAGSRRLDLYAPVSGVFSSEIDGFENYVDLSDRKNITPQLLEQADGIAYKKSTNAKKDEAVIKVVDNYEWFYAATVDARWIQDLKIGSYVLLRFPEISDKTLDANIDYISQEADGKVAIVISCMQYIDNIYSLRRANADIIRKSYSGFKVPLSAIRVKEDGKSGVYIVKDSVSLFKDIEVLYYGDEYVIAKEDNNMKNALLLYDEIIVSGSGVTDGKIIR